MALKCGLIVAFFKTINGSIGSFLSPKWLFSEKKIWQPWCHSIASHKCVNICSFQFLAYKRGGGWGEEKNELR